MNLIVVIVCVLLAALLVYRIVSSVRARKTLRDRAMRVIDGTPAIPVWRWRRCASAAQRLRGEPEPVEGENRGWKDRGRIRRCRQEAS